MQLELRSVGQLSADLQASVAEIERAIQRRQLEPAVRMNGIAYFDEAQSFLIGEALHDEPDRKLSNEESQHRAADIAYRGTSMVHGVALTLQDFLPDPAGMNEEQLTALSAAFDALHAAHNKLGQLASVLHPGEFKPVSQMSAEQLN